MKEYVSSKENQNLLKAHALKKLLTHSCTTELIFNTFDMLIDDVTDSVLEKSFRSWKPTSENIAVVNLEIWAFLRLRMESSLSAAPLDPQKKIEQLFNGEKLTLEDKTESQNMHREPLEHQKTFLF